MAANSRTKLLDLPIYASLRRKGARGRGPGRDDLYCWRQYAAEERQQVEGALVGAVTLLYSFQYEPQMLRLKRGRRTQSVLGMPCEVQASEIGQ